MPASISDSRSCTVFFAKHFSASKFPGAPWLGPSGSSMEDDELITKIRFTQLQLAGICVVCVVDVVVVDVVGWIAVGTGVAGSASSSLPLPSPLPSPLLTLSLSSASSSSPEPEKSSTWSRSSLILSLSVVVSTTPVVVGVVGDTHLQPVPHVPTATSWSPHISWFAPLLQTVGFGLATVAPAIRHLSTRKHPDAKEQQLEQP